MAVKTTTMMMTWDAADARLAAASPTNQGGEGVRGGGGEEEEEEEEVVVVEGQHRHVDVGFLFDLGAPNKKVCPAGRPINAGKGWPGGKKLLFTHFFREKR